MDAVLHISAALSAIIALYLAGSRSEPRQAHRLLAAVFALLAAQQILTSLAITGMAAAWVWWRPVLAMLLAPLIYLHLCAAAHPGARLKWPVLLHLSAPAGLVLLRAFQPDGPYLDVSIITSLLAYSAYALLRIRAETPVIRRWKFMVCGWLVAMALADSLVMIELIDSDALAQSRALLIAMSGFFVFLIYFLLTSLHRTGPLSWIASRLRRGHSQAGDLAAKLDAHMTTARPWLDPELTVARLARQLAVPQRQVSETVNDAFGMSVSRWINGWRIAEAQRLMLAGPGRPLVELMLDCGFQTRSNFNKAFSDVTGETPSAWRSSHGGSPAGRTP